LILGGEKKSGPCAGIHAVEEPTRFEVFNNGAVKDVSSTPRML
jgi:hypothetical protein